MTAETTTKLKDLKKGEFFKRKASSGIIFERGDYIRADKRYECRDVDDYMRFVYLSGSTKVHTEFEY